MLAVLIEGVVTLLGLMLLEKEEDFNELYKRKKGNYSIDGATNDLYLLRKISADEFRKLKKFQKDRNECFHNILGQKNEGDIEKYTSELFMEHKIVFKLMIEKLENELGIAAR